MALVAVAKAVIVKKVAMINIIEIDHVRDLVYSDNGNVYEVESYTDENEDVCLVEEARSVHYITYDNMINRHDITEIQLELIKDAFD